MQPVLFLVSEADETVEKLRGKRVKLAWELML
jgi:hypothetical protein